jgi:signal transduction histidine kinase
VKGLDQREDVDLLALAAEEGARFENCSVTGTPVVVSGDPALLRRMTRNLIENAERHGAPPIEVEVARDGAQARLTVSDRGRGVAESERERVFTPFFRVAGEQTPSGTGLGLTLVRQIARQHSGDALWAATPDRPSRIRVMLPAARQSG